MRVVCSAGGWEPPLGGARTGAFCSLRCCFWRLVTGRHPTLLRAQRNRVCGLAWAAGHEPTGVPACVMQSCNDDRGKGGWLAAGARGPGGGHVYRSPYPFLSPLCPEDDLALGSRRPGPARASQPYSRSNRGGAPQPPSLLPL